MDQCSPCRSGELQFIARSTPECLGAVPMTWQRGATRAIQPRRYGAHGSTHPRSDRERHQRRRAWSRTYVGYSSVGMSSSQVTPIASSAGLRAARSQADVGLHDARDVTRRHAVLRHMPMNRARPSMMAATARRTGRSDACVPRACAPHHRRSARCRGRSTALFTR